MLTEGGRFRNLFVTFRVFTIPQNAIVGRLHFRILCTQGRGVFPVCGSHREVEGSHCPRGRVYLLPGPASFPDDEARMTDRSLRQIAQQTDNLLIRKKGVRIKTGAIHAFLTCFHKGHDRVVEDIII